MLPLFNYVVETERRFYLANEVKVSVRNGSAPTCIEVELTDAWVWDMYRPARFVPQRQGPHLPGRERGAAARTRHLSVAARSRRSAHTDLVARRRSRSDGTPAAGDSGSGAGAAARWYDGRLRSRRNWRCPAARSTWWRSTPDGGRGRVLRGEDPDSAVLRLPLRGRHPGQATTAAAAGHHVAARAARAGSAGALRAHPLRRGRRHGRRPVGLVGRGAPGRLLTECRAGAPWRRLGPGCWWIGCRREHRDHHRGA